MAARRNRKLTGTVLVGVMWLLVLMMAILAVGAQNSRLDTRTSLSSVEKIRCRWLARSGAETAMAYLKDDLKDADSLLDEWAISNNEDLQNVQMTDGTYTVIITDECSKLNLNTATASQLLSLDTASMNETITDSILDWRDTDEDIRTNGAESGYYLNLDVGYLCRNGNFRTPREVLRVRGVTDDLFYGQNDRILGQGGWSRFLTCYSAVKNVDASGNPRVNVNSARESDLISKLSLSASQARYITQNRPFTNLAGLIGIKINTTGSTNKGSGNSGGSSQNSRGNSSGTGGSGSSQIGPQSLNSPVGASLPIQRPQFSTVAALLAADGDASGAEPPPGERQDGRRDGGRGEGRGGRRGEGRGEGRGRERGQGQGGMTGGRGGGTSRGGGGGNAQAQAQPLDWATFSRIFDQITISENTSITGQININTVGIEVLRAFLDDNDDLANKIISYRNGQGGEITNVCNLINVDGMTQRTLAKYLDQFSVRSSVYLIRATAQSKSCGVHYFIEIVIDREQEGREVLYKLEGIGN